MSSGERTHVANLRATLGNSKDGHRFAMARTILRRHLVMTRDTPIGRDYVFTGAPEEVKSALKDLIDIEHRYGGGLQLDFAPVNGYFLLRIIGDPNRQSDVIGYFDAE